jgi:hypothetical protein
MTDEKYTRLGCVGCAAPTKIFVSSGKQAKWCGRECRLVTKANADRFSESRPGCAVCGASMIGRMRNAIHCSKYCGTKDWRSKNPERFVDLRAREADKAAALKAKTPKSCKVFFKDCAYCRKSYTARGVLSEYCSKQCLYDHGVRRQHAKDALVLSCTICQCSFCPMYGHSQMQVCGSPDCRLIVKRIDNGLGRARRRYRAATQGKERVNPFRVFDRDRWTCHLCKRKTPRKLRGTHDPMAPELDHIIPLAAGGSHTYVNTACACRACNQAKSAKPLGQLLLIG